MPILLAHRLHAAARRAARWLLLPREPVDGVRRAALRRSRSCRSCCRCCCWRAFQRRRRRLPARRAASRGSRASASSTRSASTASRLFLVLLTTFLTPIVILAAFGRHPEAREGVLHPHAACSRPACSARFVALDLFLFYVFWELMLVPMYFLIGVWGGPAPRLRGDQVLPLHDGRQPADAGRDPLPASLRTCRRPARRRPSTYGSSTGARRSTAREQLLAVRRLRARLRDQGADVPAAHLAARRAHRGADRRLGDPGRRAAQDGHLRLPALRDAALPDAAARRRRPLMRRRSR